MPLEEENNMKLKALMTAGAVLAMLSAPLSAQDSAPQGDFDARITEKLKSAQQAARRSLHLGLLNSQCVNAPSFGAPKTADNLPRYIEDPSEVPPREDWFAEPAQVFDDLYFVGGSEHSAWILETSDGLILIDTIFPYNSEELIVGGMERLGLDPADIRYIVISHAHGDHIGGVEIMQDVSGGAPVVMGEADWQLVETYPNRFKTMTPDPEGGIRVSERMDLSLGDTTIDVIPTPGHTPGTLSFVFTVHDFGRPVTVAYNGGTYMSFQSDQPDPGIANADEFIASVDALATGAEEAGATVLLSNHSIYDDATVKSKLIQSRGYAPHPFEEGADSVQDYFSVMRDCAMIRRLELERMAATN